MLNIYSGDFKKDIINILDDEISEFESLKESDNVIDAFNAWIYLVGLKYAKDLIDFYIKNYDIKHDDILSDVYGEDDEELVKWLV